MNRKFAVGNRISGVGRGGLFHLLLPLLVLAQLGFPSLGTVQGALRVGIYENAPLAALDGDKPANGLASRRAQRFEMQPSATVFNPGEMRAAPLWQVPEWTNWVWLSALGLILLLAVLYLIVRAQVKARTAELAAKNESLEEEVKERRRVEQALRESENRIRSYFETGLIGIGVYTREINLIEANDRLCEILGYAREELLGKSWVELTHPDDVEAEVGQFKRIQAGEIEGYTLEKRCIRKDGQILDVSVSTNCLRRDDGSVDHLVTLMLDITESKRAEETLQLTAKVFENTREGIIITDADARIVTVNKAFSTITGYTLEEVIGKNPRILKSGLQDEAFYEDLWKTLLETDTWQGEVWNKRKDGSIYPQSTSLGAVRNSRGEIINFVGVFYDITARKQAEKRLEHLATHDPLTNLPNRLLFHDRLSHALEHAKRQRNRLAILFLDLDDFKVLNDTHGHEKGDQLLKQVAQRLRSTARASDTVARLGGDEFTFIIENCTSSEDVVTVAKKVLGAFSEPYAMDGLTYPITASVGISIYPDHGQDADALLKNADTAMYHVKESGKNDYRLYSISLRPPDGSRRG